MSLPTPRSLNTRVGRRLFGVFLAFALVPVLLFSGNAYREVSAELEGQAEERLHQMTKSQAMGVAERLHLVSDLIGTRGTLYLISRESPVRAVLLEDLPPGVLGIKVLQGDQLPSGDLSQITDVERDHLIRGRPVLKLTTSREFWIGLRLNDLEHERVMWAHLDSEFVWGTKDGRLPLPPSTDFCAFGPGEEPLTCTTNLARSALPMIDGGSVSSAARSFRWTEAGEEHMASVWPLFLGFEFAAGSWDVVVSEPRSYVMAPIRRFQSSFILIALMVVAVISGLSARFIQAQMTPLERLRAGTAIVARGEFDHRVEVTSEDEFGDLSRSFNQMATDLGRQVRTLEAGHAIDRAVLSSLTQGKIVDTVLREAPGLVPGNAVGVALALDSREPRAWTVSALNGRAELVEARIRVSEQEWDELSGAGDVVAIDLKAQPEGRSYLSLDPLRKNRSAAHAFPVIHGVGLQGVIILSWTDRPTLDPSERHRVRQLADRIAVAVSNARLVEDLDQMHQGTLTTLARTIDAKSPWTAGHSERVTELAVALGRKLGLDANGLTRLHRGGLLHDVGKIGVSAEILDKPYALTDAEREIMESHTVIGARILGPIAAYNDITAIVRHHHERWDGMGYPDQLRAEAIPFDARIMALADVYDALTSARPYRAGWEHDAALAAIQRGSGSAFDPTLTLEFLSLMTSGWTPTVPRAGGAPDPKPAFATVDMTEALLRG